MLDKISMKLLEELYKKDLSEEDVNKIINRTDIFQPDPHLSQLKGLIISHIVEGVKDGAGGYADESVKRVYSITPDGRAVVEQDRKSETDKWIDRLSNLIP